MHARTLANTLLLAGILTGVACDGATPGGPSPPVSAPSGPAGPLSPGSYLLTIFAPDGIVHEGRIEQACAGAGPSQLTVMGVQAIVEADGQIARVRPAGPAGGDFELWLLPAAAPQMVTGGARGVLVNTWYPPAGAPTDARATLTAAASGEPMPLDGTVQLHGSLASGRVHGPVVVWNTGGASVACVPGTVSWSLSRQF